MNSTSQTIQFLRNHFDPRDLQTISEAVERYQHVSSTRSHTERCRRLTQIFSDASRPVPEPPHAEESEVVKAMRVVVRRKFEEGER